MRNLLVPVLLLLMAAVACRPKEEAPIRDVFVCTPSAPLLLTPRSGFKPIRELPNGERISVLFERDEWLKVRTAKHEEGWMAASNLAEMPVLASSLKLSEEARQALAQFHARLTGESSLRIDPAKNAPYARRLPKNSEVDVLDRNVHGRAGAPPFYKVRSPDGHVGWVALWLVEPIYPEALLAYQEERKLAACIVLDRVPTPSGELPEFVLADLSAEADTDVDFDRIRVFTWNEAKSEYGTAFVERRLRGVLPLGRDTSEDGSPRVHLIQVSRGGDRTETTFVYKAPYFRKETAGTSKPRSEKSRDRR